MVEIKSNREIELMRDAGKVLAEVHEKVGEAVAPGKSTLELNDYAERLIRKAGCTPSFLHLYDFPAACCVSVNEELIHGIPTKDRILKEGDIISIDCGTKLNGFVGDSAYTFCVGDVAEDVRKLLRTTKEALYKGIEQARVGNRVGDISSAVQTYCEKQNYSVVRELVGHGCGRKMHEEPEVPNYGRRGCGPVLKSGMCICIEPMINQGSKHVVFESDGWTVRTKDRKCSAHFEHCIAIRPEGPMILSSFEYLEEIVGKEI